MDACAAFLDKIDGQLVCASEAQTVNEQWQQRYFGSFDYIIAIDTLELFGAAATAGLKSRKCCWPPDLGTNSFTRFFRIWRTLFSFMPKTTWLNALWMELFLMSSMLPVLWRGAESGHF